MCEGGRRGVGEVGKMCEGGRRDVRQEVGEMGEGKQERCVKGSSRTDVGREYMKR
jgi:hypothetical protein